LKEKRDRKMHPSSIKWIMMVILYLSLNFLQAILLVSTAKVIARVTTLGIRGQPVAGLHGSQGVHMHPLRF
jgi:hypothetical protein